jgi:hypothetical protein
MVTLVQLVTHINKCRSTKYVTPSESPLNTYFKGSWKQVSYETLCGAVYCDNGKSPEEYN